MGQHATVMESLRLCAPVPIESMLFVEGDLLPNGTPVEKDCMEFKPEQLILNYFSAQLHCFLSIFRFQDIG
ncbi:hypothetical protein SUGI_1100420 [Cryptomeria japonica]|nr:hypothetical protein SUGI_1100420 [Cryptomeria japonica]